MVHFRNLYQRGGVGDEARLHSLHAHGLQRAALYDGAYPLSPADPAQASRRGDRIAPGASFTYRWDPTRTYAGLVLFFTLGMAFFCWQQERQRPSQRS